MKKKLSLLLFALLAVAAFAGLRGVTASTDVVWQLSDFDFVKNTLGVPLPKANSATYIEEPITYEGVTMTTFKSTNFPGIFINSDSSQISLRIYKISGENKGGIQFSVPEGTKITKIVINGDSKVAQLVADKGTKEMSNSNKTLTWTSDSEEGVQAVKFENDNSSNTVRINDITITKVESGDPQPDYYVVGSMNEWKVDADYKLTTNAATAGEYMTTLELPANTELKVVASTDGETISAYYPDNAPNLTINEEGKYDIYFRPDGQGGQDWYYGYIYAKAVEPKPYSTSFNIEQFVLDEGTKADAKAALAAHNIEFANIDALDSLNDEKTARNEPFLGLKVKAQGGFINVVLEKGKKLNVKFGCINAPVNVSIDGTVDEAKQIAANTAGGTVFTLEAGDADREVTFTTTTAKTVVFKQIMIDEDIAEVILPAQLKTFTATVTNDAAWNEVYAYAWTKDAASGEVTKFLGDWPGTQIRPTEAGDFILSFQAEEAPDSIIFNNGSGEQTADLAFENGGTYTNAKPEVQKYNVILYDGMVNGTVDADKFEAAEGDQVLLLVTPNDGFDIDQLTVATQDGAPIETRQIIGGDYNYSFVMPGGDVNVSATFKEKAQPEETSYTIKFKDAGEGAGDGTAAKTSIEDLIADGAVYVKATTATKAFNGKEGYGVKLSSGNANGSMTLTLAQSVKPTKITFKASAWVNSNDVADAASISINGKDAQELTKDLTEYTVNYDGETEVSEIAIAATKRAYITELTVTYTDEGGGGDQPVEIKTMAIVGDFLGLEATGESNNPNWDPANGWQMTQSTDDPAIWTYVKEGFVAEAKTYEYKATANGNWKDYVLPQGDNANFQFGTEGYPAGTYNLTFTANTSKHTLTLDVAKDGISTVKELNALANKKEFTFTGNAIVVAHEVKEATNTNDHYIYIKDETGASLIYDKGGAHTNSEEYALKVGNVITAPWTGRVNIYNGLFQVVPTGEEQLKATSTVEVKYPEATADDVKAENVNQVVEIKGLSIKAVNEKNITFAIGNDDITGYNQFGIELPADYEGKTFDVVGAIGIYGENAQFWPMTFTEVVAPEPQPFAASFTTDKKWENVYAYTWSGDNVTAAKVEQLGQWPGKKLEATDAGYVVTFEAAEAPDFIIFNDGTNDGSEVVGVNKTADLPFVNSNLYSFTTEKTTAYVGDPEEKISTAKGIEIPAATCVYAGVQAEKIIRIVAKEIAVAAPARGLDNTVTEGETIPFTVTKKDGTLLVEDKDITVTDDPGSGGKAYEFTVSPDASTEVTTNGFIIKPKDEKNIAVTAIEVEKAKAPAAEDINITPEAGADIAEALATAKAAVAKVGNITINLTADANYTVSAPIEVPANVTINGAAGATIDASALDAPFIQMSTTPSVEPTAVGDINVYNIDGVNIKNVKITGVKKQLFYANKMQYLLQKLSVDNCIIEMAGTKTIFDFNSGGNVVELAVNNSTISGPADGWSNGGFHSTQSSKSVQQLGGTTEKTVITNSTLYNISKGKTTSTIVKNSQAWMSYEVKNNIIVNCGKSGQFLKGLNNGQPGKDGNWDVDNNVFNFDDANVVESAGESAATVKNSIAGVIKFADAANGDFNAVLGTEDVPAEPTTAVGDPRWTVTNKQVGINVVIAPTEGDISAALAAAIKPITEAGKKVGDITINLTAGAAYTVNASIEAPANVTINGAAGATIDASALDAPFIQMSTTPSVEPTVVGDISVYNIDGVNIKNVKITGAKKQLFYANKMQYLLQKLSVDNCIIEMAGTKTIFDFNSGGNVVELAVNNSTISGPAEGWSNGGFHSTQSSKSVQQLGGSTEKTVITNSTLYNISKGKTTSTIVKNSQAWMSYEVKNNIIVNCGKSGQFLKGLNNGQPGKDGNWDVDNNVFNFDDANVVESAGESAATVKNSVKGVIAFADAAAGDFNAKFVPAAGQEQPATIPGDPRWTITAIDQLYLLGGVGEWKLDEMAALTYNAGTFEYELTVKAPDAYFTIVKGFADNWDDVNKNRYGIGAGDQVITLDTPTQLEKYSDGTIVVNGAGIYKISISDDLKITVTKTGDISVEKLYIMGNGTPGGWDATTELTFNEETQAFEYDATVKEDTYLTFGDAAFTTWDDFNGKHRFALAEGNNEPTLDQATQLSLVNDGSILLKDPGTYKISITKGLVMTVISSTTAINGIEATAEEANAPIYNLSGQKVTKSYKGVVIKNGKKYMQK